MNDAALPLFRPEAPRWVFSILRKKEQLHCRRIARMRLTTLVGVMPHPLRPVGNLFWSGFLGCLARLLRHQIDRHRGTGGVVRLGARVELSIH